MGSGEGGLAAFLREDQPSRQYMRHSGVDGGRRTTGNH